MGPLPLPPLTLRIHSYRAPWRFLLAVLAVLFLQTRCGAQETPPPEEPGLVKAAGSATITGDFYDFTAGGSPPVATRRPPSLIRLIITPTITLGGRVDLPFNIVLSSRETSTITPPVHDASLTQFLLNQANSFGISPKFGWAQFNLGSHTPKFSELSIGDAQLFGIGADLRPGKFHLAVSAGVAQRAVQTDTVALTRGAYARHIYAATVGYGTEESEVALNVVRARDDPASIRELQSPLIVAPDSADPSYRDTTYARNPLMPTPQEGFVATLSARIPIAEGLNVAAEAGAGLFTRDMYSADIGERAATLNTLVRQRISSRADGAGKISMALKKESWGVDVTALYIGPGYVTLGYPYMQADRLEFTVAPTALLFDSVLTVTGTFGHRTSNLAQSSGATTRQILISANIDARIAEGLTLATAYSNFGLTTDVSNDTFRIRSIAQSFSLTPTWALPTDAIVHTITASFALDDYNDLNPITGAQSSNRTRTMLGSYAAAFLKIPLTASATGTYLTNDLAIGALTVQSVSFGLGYRLFNGAVAPGLTITYTRSQPADATTDSELGIRLSAIWRITPRLRLNVAASANDYTYGSSHSGGSFRENLLRTALGWQF
ncbi:MAG: hypothetical protein ABIR47_06600 [Candidatus Kapaibacterium sp.]